MEVRKHHREQVVSGYEKTEKFCDLKCTLLDGRLIIQNQLVDHLAQYSFRVYLNVLLDAKHYVVKLAK